MALLENTGGFTINWIIENILYRVGVVYSPKFVVKSLASTKWQLNLFLIGDNDNFVSYFIERAEDDNGPDQIDISFSICLKTGTGCSRNYSFYRGDVFTEVLAFHEYNKILYQEEDGSIKVQFKMWQEGNKTVTTEMLTARTNIIVKHFCTTFKIENPFNCDSANKKTLEIFKSLNGTSLNGGGVYLIFYFENSTDEYPVHILNGSNRHQILLKGKISIIDMAGTIIRSTHGQFKFGLFKEEWLFPLSLDVEKLASERHLYLENDSLSLFIEFTFNDGLTVFELEETISNTPPTVKPFYASKSTQIEGCKPEIECASAVATIPNETSNDTTVSDGGMEATLLQEDLLNLYIEKQFCDVTLMADGEGFSAHKCILTARSPVFKAMFNTDMLENHTNEINIPNMRKNILGQFLRYIYSEKLELLRWDDAKHLYSAADQYQVLTLKNRCITYLKTNLTFTNICETLDLSDKHNDEQLKDICTDFIYRNSKEVFESEEWKSLTVGNPLLAAVTIQKYFKNT